MKDMDEELSTVICQKEQETSYWNLVFLLAIRKEWMRSWVQSSAHETLFILQASTR